MSDNQELITTGDTDLGADGGDRSVQQLDYGAYDGWRVTTDEKSNENGDWVDVYLELHFGGKALRSVFVCPLSRKDELTATRLQRLLVLLDTVAGYLNAGGDLEEIESLMPALRSANDESRIELPEGWKPLEWVHTVEHDEYVFINEKEGLIHRVIPEEFDETLPLAEYRQVSEDDDEPISPDAS